MSCEPSPLKVKNLLIIGDFLHQHMVAEQEDKLKNPNIPRSLYTDFEIYSGSFLFEHLTRYCLEYLWLKAPGNELRTRRGATAFARQMIHGPSRLVTDLADPDEKGARRDAIFDIARKEHISLVRSGTRSKRDKAHMAYRIARNMGRSDSRGERIGRALKNYQPEVLLLSVDFHKFLQKTPSQYFHDFDPLQAQGLPMLVRIAVGPDVDPTNGVFSSINRHLAQWAKVSKPSIAVISSGSLRACGHDISYRKTWERTIADTVEALRRIKTDADAIDPASGAPEGRNGDNKHAPLCLGAFDWVVVTFYNDAALAVPMNALVRADEGEWKGEGSEPACIFASEPESIEQDLSLKLEHQTKATETLVTQALAIEWAKESTDSDADKINRAIIHGLKASRYLLLHGFEAVKVGGPWTEALRFDRCVVGDAVVNHLQRNERDLFDDREEIEQGGIYDVKLYLWNRSRSADYFETQNELMRDFTARRSGRGTPSLVTWPFGDVAEILCEGYPLHGSFPPIGLRLEEGREKVENSTGRTSKAYHWASWLEATEIPLRLIRRGEDAWLGLAPQTAEEAPKTLALREAFHDQGWWSLEFLYLYRLGQRIRFRTDVEYDGSERLAFAEFLFGVALVRFGEKWINRSSMSPERGYSLKILSILLSTCEEAFPKEYRGKDLHAMYGNVDRAATLDSFFPEAGIELPSAMTPTATLDKLRKQVKDPAKSSIFPPSDPSPQGILPYLKIGDLRVTSRRDIQSCHDIKERIAAYQASSQRRPLNLAVFGPPGSGKSFAVKRILTETFGAENVDFHEFNLASIGSPDQLAGLFLRLQESSLNKKFPVAFWDEYDTSLEKPLGWLAHFLGPMQDGKFVLDGQLRSLPPTCFVFAGSMFSSFGEMLLLDASSRGKKAFSSLFMPLEDGLRDEWNTWLDRSEPETAKIGKFTVEQWANAKGTDFKSRLAGVLNIQGIERAAETRIDDQFNVWTTARESNCSTFVRKARGIRAQLERRFKELIIDTEELMIRDNTILSLLHEEHYAHGLRSIENIIDMFVTSGRDIVDLSAVPTGDQRRIHMSVDAFDLG